ncbi:MAG: hypothetical protein ACR2J3_01875 [Aridibacter sp.]
MSNIYKFLFLVSLLCCISCTQTKSAETVFASAKPTPTSEKTEKIKNDAKVIHVLVALCDNENQGIVPVPASLGNGEDPQRNLYWGAAYGVKTYFTSKSWEKLTEIENPKENVLQRIIFKHKQKNVYLIADAYRGIKIKETIEDFISAASGEKLENIKVGNKTLQILGSADVISFVGHNGLMDFKLDKEIIKTDDDKRESIILACASRQYFAEHLKQTSAKPLLWTSNLMAPEAYILHDALEGWINNETDEQIQTRAAQAYSKYQKISLRSAKRLLVTGW